jgi:hypothetical protein
MKLKFMSKVALEGMALCIFFAKNTAQEVDRMVVMVVGEGM